MKRIGILTLYHKNYNYGGLLQAYALQHALEKLGTKAEQISYALETGYPGYSVLKYQIRRFAADLIHLIKFREWEVCRIKRIILFDRFAELIPHSRTVSAQNIGDLNNAYDYFVFGSDQIWNPIGWQPTLLGSFVNNGKHMISYAASISRDSLSEEEYLYIVQFLKRFDKISVRENNAVDYLNKRFPELNVCFMPDPVFLLSKEEWESVIADYSNIQFDNGAYAFCYFLGEDKKNREQAIKYSDDVGVKALFVSHFEKKHVNWEKKYKSKLTGPCAPGDFLAYIYHADLIITDSFHGAALAIVFERPFYVLRRFHDSDKRSMNSRLVSLLHSFSLEHRQVDELDIAVSYEFSSKELENIRNVKMNFRNTGISFLKDNIQI